MASDVPIPAAAGHAARSPLAVRLLAGAAVIGILGDALLRTGPWGVNFPLWAAAFLLAIVLFTRAQRGTLPREASWLLLPCAVFASMFIWRASPALGAFNVVAFLFTLTLLAAALSPAPAVALIGARIRDLIANGANAVFSAIIGVLPLTFSDVKLHELPRRQHMQTFAAAARGLLFAIPLLVVFGALFMHADPVFSRLVRETLRIDIDELLTHLVFLGVITALAAGYLRGALLTGPLYRTPNGPRPALGALEVGLTLGALDTLFLAFVLVQLRYFFGGEAVVLSTGNLTYAEYARRGFFELVVVALLVLPVLLAASAFLRTEGGRAERVFRVLAGVLLLLLFVVMYSAVVRMRLYQQTYGLTEDRLYATVVMGWLAVVFVWFAVTVLRGRSRHFAAGLVISGWVTLAALNIVNPEALIVRVNAARMAAGHRFDARYASTLSADAVPALVDALVASRVAPIAPALTPEQEQADHAGRCAAVQVLLDRYPAASKRDWRTWNVARSRANAAVRAREAELRAMSCPEPRRPMSR